jgi:hypothetical protein
MDIINWEKNYRDLLNKELSEGYYDLSSDDFTLFTGKKGYIDYLVRVKKKLLGYE